MFTLSMLTPIGRWRNSMTSPRLRSFGWPTKNTIRGLVSVLVKLQAQPYPLTDSFRKFKERNLVKPAEKEAAERKEKEQAAQEVLEAELAQAMKVGARCEIGQKDGLKRRGEVAFVG